MSKILHLIGSPREEKSRTLELSATFLSTFKGLHPDWIIDELDLAKENLPPLTAKRADGKYMILQGKDLFGDMKESWEEIVRHIDRFLAADIYVVSAPMWNFSIPYLLKQYIDLIVQPKYLFRYTQRGVEGLAKNKKMIVVTTRGGEYSSEEMQPFDFHEPYLRTIFGFVGIIDIAFIKAEPVDGSIEIRKEKMERGHALAKQLALKVIDA